MAVAGRGDPEVSRRRGNRRRPAGRALGAAGRCGYSGVFAPAGCRGDRAASPAGVSGFGATRPYTVRSSRPPSSPPDMRAPPAALRPSTLTAAWRFWTPIALSVSGLVPGEQVTLSASATDCSGYAWVSSAVFTADSTGNVDLGSDAPASGSYQGKHAMGLLWSLTPPRRVHRRRDVVRSFRPPLGESDRACGARCSACGAGGDRRALLTVDATQLDRAETFGRSHDITPAAPNLDYFRRAQKGIREFAFARARGKTGFLRSAEVSWDAWEISCRERSCYVPGPGRFRGAPG